VAFFVMRPGFKSPAKLDAGLLFVFRQALSMLFPMQVKLS
jgi:hypothetical protein